MTPRNITRFLFNTQNTHTLQTHTPADAGDFSFNKKTADAKTWLNAMFFKFCFGWLF